MKRLLTILITILIISTGFIGLFQIGTENATAQTYVSGTISTNTTWNLAGSPYIVTGDVLVQTGVTLKIDPGVVVKFNGTYSLIVDGTLYANGTAGNHIKFTSNQTTPQKGDWYTIRLRTKNNILNWTEIEYATYGVFMTFFGANNIIANSTVKNCSVDGIFITNSDNNTIYNCNISSSDRYGMTLYQSDNTTIDKCNILYNNYFGINLNASLDTRIENTNISHTTGKGIRLYANSNHTMMKNVTVYNNSIIGIDLSGSGYNNISDSLIMNNMGPGIDFGGGIGHNILYNTTVIGNDGTGIDLRGSSYVDIVGCNVSRNKNKGGIYSESAVTNINITNSEIWNNSAGNGLDFYSATWVNITNSKFIANAGNGISFNGSNVQENNLIDNCTIAGNGNNGIYFYAYSTYSYIQNNNIYSNDIYTNGQNGIYFYVYAGNNNNYAYIQNNNIYSNTIYSNNQNGIYFYSGAYYKYTYIQNNNIYSNTIYSNNQNGIYFYTVIVYWDYSYIQNNNIYSNTIYSNNLNGIYFYAYDYKYSHIQNNNIYSNTIYSNNLNGIYFYAYAENDYTYIQNNNIYSNTILWHNVSNGLYFRADNPATTWQPSYLYNNTITSNLIGIEFLRIKSHVVYTNNISNSTRNGILLEQSASNTFRYNTFANNNWTGINLTYSSSNNKIENNNISFNNQTGILISGNSNNNVLTRNDFIDNSAVGLNITNATGNQIHRNNFKNNTQNAYDTTNALNDWDDGAEGNCWSDYTGTDDDSDGIGEDPYVIPGGGSRDWHPFMNYLNIKAPYIISTLPARFAKNVLMDSNVTINFSKEMNTTAVENAISISGSLTPTNFVWTYGNHTVTFTPSSNLASKTTYTVTITTSAKDVQGNWIEAIYKLSFTSQDIESPKISSTWPANSAINTPIDTNIIVTFNEPMQTSTVTYSCTPDPGGWNTSWSSGDTVATFTHNDLGSEVTYTFQITAAKDNAELDLIGGPVPNPWSFTTPDIIGPEISSTSPVDKTQNVSTTADIVVTFNEKMNTASLTYSCKPDTTGWSRSWSNNDKTVTFSHNEFKNKTTYTFQITGAKDTSGNDLNPGAIPNPFSFTTTGDYTPPTISLTSPANNAVNVEPDTKIVVTFSKSMDNSTLKYTCIPDPGGWSEIWSAGDTVVTLSHNSFNSSVIYVFKITGAKDTADNELATGSVPNPWSFQITDYIAPTITLTSPPNSSTTVVQSANMVVKFSEPMNITSVSFVCNPNPGNWSTLWSSGNTIATFTHDPFEAATWYTFEIIAGKDLVGNDLTAGTIPNPCTFSTTDIEGPKIISVSPLNGAVGVGRTQNIIVTFNEKIQTSTMVFSCAPDPGNWNVVWGSGDSVAILSHDAFVDETTHTFQIMSAKDLAGNDLVVGSVPNPWTFTSIDLTPPKMINTIPANNTTDVDVDTNIVITFSETVNTTTLTYLCTPDPGDWSVSWSAGNTVATLLHNPFEVVTIYTFELSSAKDLAGNDLVDSNTTTSWSFKTITVKSIVVTPNIVTVAINTTTILQAQAYDSQNNPLDNVTYLWSMSNNLGSIAPHGIKGVTFTAATTIGHCYVNVTAGNRNASAFITITPGKLHRMEVTPSIASVQVSTTLGFTMQGYDKFDNPISDLIATWNVDENIGTVEPVVGTATTFTAGTIVGTGYVYTTVGEYTANAKITIVKGPLDHISITPNLAIIGAGEQKQFTAQGYDKFNNIVQITPTWSIDGGGVIDTEGKFTAIYIGTWNVRAALSGVKGNATVVVSPSNLDTDSDGMPDWFEYKYNLNPFDSTDPGKDEDNDGLTHLQEYLNDTDPYDGDTDGDQLGDGFEVIFTQTDPINWDTNGNGIGDGIEFIADDPENDYDGYSGKMETLPNDLLGTTLSYSNYTVLIETSSSMLEGKFDKDEKKLDLKVSGKDSSTGITTLMIPKDLCAPEDIIISLDDAPVDYTLTDNATYYSAHVEYHHSVRDLKVSFKPTGDVPPSYILSTYPEDGELNVSVDDLIIYIEFSEPLDLEDKPSKLRDIDFDITSEFFEDVLGTITYIPENNMLKFMPDVHLGYGMKYFVSVYGLRTAVGIEVPEHSWGFTTALLIVNTKIEEHKITIEYAGTGDLSVEEKTSISVTPPEGMTDIGLFVEVTSTGMPISIYIEITYSTGDLPKGSDANTLKLYYYDDETYSWEEVEMSGVNIEREVVWVQVDHLTVFSPMAKESGKKGKEEGIKSENIMPIIGLIIIIIVIFSLIGVVLKRKPKRAAREAITQAPGGEPQVISPGGEPQVMQSELVPGPLVAAAAEAPTVQPQPGGEPQIVKSQTLTIARAQESAEASEPGGEPQ